MSVKNLALGGTDWVTGDYLLADDLNDTFNQVDTNIDTTNTNITKIQAELTENLVFHALCNDTSGTTLSSEIGEDGTVSNASIWNASGKLSRCLYNASLYYGTIPNINLFTNWTIALWFKPNAFNNGNIILHGIISITVTSSTSIGTDAGSFTVPTMSAGTWYHLIITNRASELKLYLDNVESSTGTRTGNQNWTAATAYIGHSNGTSSMDGYVDDVRLYGRVISSTERARIYNSGTGVE